MSTKLSTFSCMSKAFTSFLIHRYWLLFGKMTKSIQNPVAALVVQIVLDSIIFSPVTVSGYLTVRSLLEGTGFAGAKEKCTAKLLGAVMGAWKFWPAVNVINFSIVPMHFRVLYMNVMSVFWSGYLTHVNSKKVTN